MQTHIPDDQSNSLAILPEIVPEDLLPSLRLWQRLGGLVGVITVGTAFVLCQTVTYRETIKAPMMIRPEGDLRVVDATASGRIRQIMVRENDRVNAGDEIAYLDDTRLQNEIRQLQNSEIQIQRQLAQVDNQLQSLSQRMLATANQVQGNLRSTTAELTLAQQQLRERQLVSQAELREIQAEINLAQENVDRYSQLVDQGAIAVTQLREQEVTLETAHARFERAKATAQPNLAEVTIAQQQIVQVEAQGNATLAQLQQEIENLNQQYSNLLNELNQIQQELVQTNTEITLLTLRAPVTGTIQTLELRNRTQVVNLGDPIAQIAADDDTLIAKAWVASQDINTIKNNQSAQLRISACPYTDYGTLEAKVQAISPDTLPQDTLPEEVRNTSNSSLYEVTLQLSDSVLHAQQQSCNLQAGMAGRADILTQKETVLRIVLRKLRLITQL